MIDNDIKKMFYKKNQEIIINKLLLDLDNNIDSLLATMDNIIYLEFAIYKDKLINIDVNSSDNIENVVDMYEDYLKKKIRDILSIKKDKCSSYLKNEVLNNDIEDYKGILFETTGYVDDTLLEEIEKYLNTKLKKKISSDWYEKNIDKASFFLEEKLTKDIVKKLISQLKDRDVIIYNNAYESYQKYLLLNENVG